MDSVCGQAVAESKYDYDWITLALSALTTITMWGAWGAGMHPDQPRCWLHQGQHAPRQGRDIQRPGGVGCSDVRRQSRTPPRSLLHRLNRRDPREIP
jgi:hypothetical protein